MRSELARRPARAKCIAVRITLLVETDDRRLSPREAARTLVWRRWLVADHLSGLLTWGGPRAVRNPSVQVVEVMTRPVPAR